VCDPDPVSAAADAPDDDGALICVFCGSNAGASDAFVATARELGAGLAARGLGLVYGGGKVGLMGQVADAALAAGGRVIGVIPEHMVPREVAHGGLTRLEVTPSMHARKARMAELAVGFVALPGGFGTFEEVIEILTWNQLGLMAKPVVLLDVDGFYTPLLRFFDAAVDARFVRPEHRALAQRATSVTAAIEAALAPPPATPHKWLDLDARRT
jgi:uncharacterized protein (TIGR00730 family)